MLIGAGTLSGRNRHVLQGSFTLNRQDDGSVLMETSADFFFDGAPDPGWALFQGEPMGVARPKVHAAALATRFGRLPGGVVAVHGIQSGVIPAAFDMSQVDHLFLWCFDPQTPFLLGIGPIEHI